MADFETNDDEYQDYTRLRERRVLAYNRALVVEQELRDSRTLQLIIDAIGEDSEAAMHEFAYVNPMDTLAVSALQARVHRLVYLRQTINDIRLQGDAAGMALAEESFSEQNQ